MGFKDWEKANPDKDKKKFEHYWRKVIPPNEKQVCRSIPSRLILSDTSSDLKQVYEDRANELVRRYCLCYSSRYLSNIALI
jgi:hypothetical protein